MSQNIQNVNKCFKNRTFIAKPKTKILDFNMKMKLNRKGLYPTDAGKFLEVKINSKLNWKSYVNATVTKINRAMPCSTK